MPPRVSSKSSSSVGEDIIWMEEEDDDDDNFRTAEEVAEYGEGENAVAEPRSRRVERGAVAMILIFKCSRF